MSNNFKFVLNKAGVRNLLQSNEMQSVLRNAAQEVQSKAGDGYVLSTHVGANRANASVAASDKKAKKDNLKNNTLLKALGSIKV